MPLRIQTSWLRYSLRGVMLLILLAGLGCAWLYYEVNAAREQRLAVEAILAYGGEVTFNGSTTISTLDEATRQLPAPTWWTRLLGEDPRLRVTRVRLRGPGGNQANFDELIELITTTSIQGGESVDGIPQFEGELSLVIIGGQVVHEDDGQPSFDEQPTTVAKEKKPEPARPSGEEVLRLLPKLRGLKLLEIRDHTIEHAAISELRAKLPELEIDDTDTRSFTFSPGGGLF